MPTDQDSRTELVGAAQEAHRAVQDEVDRVLGQLEVAQAEVTGRMVDGILAEVPLYRKLTDRRRLADVEAQCSRQVTMFVARGRGGAAFADADLAEVRAATARRAKELVPLDSLLHATRVAHRVAREWLIDHVDDGPTGKVAALRLSDLGIEHADAISTVIATEYVRWEGRRILDEDRIHRGLLERLLSGAPALDDDAAGVVLANGLREGPYATLVATTQPLADADAVDPRECANLVVRALVRGGIPAFGAARHGETVVVAAVGSASLERAREVAGEICAALAPMHRLEARAGISRAHEKLDEVPLAYADASRALRHSRPGSVASLAEVPLVDYLWRRRTRSRPSSCRLPCGAW